MNRFLFFFFLLKDKIHFLPVSHFFMQTWANRVGEGPVCRDAVLDAWKLPGVVRNPVSKSKMKKWLRKTPGSDLWPPCTQAQAPAHTCMPTIRNTYTQHTHIHTQRKGGMAAGSAALSSPLPQAPLPAPGTQRVNSLRAQALLAVHLLTFGGWSHKLP